MINEPMIEELRKECDQLRADRHILLLLVREKLEEEVPETSELSDEDIIAHIRYVLAPHLDVVKIPKEAQ